MRQLFTIFKFEFLNYVKSKTFIILTSLMILVIGGILFYPRVFGGNKNAEGGDGGAIVTQKTVVALIDHSGADARATAAYLSASSYSYEFEAVARTEDEIKQAVASGEYAAALILETPLTYKYVVPSLGMYETGNYEIDSLLVAKYRFERLSALGVTSQEAGEILSAAAHGEIVEMGENKLVSFLYTYVLVFLLYMAIMLYGQFVATSVASEKSSRAMELLITSARPTNMMFGKVIGSGCAGLLQMSLILGAGFVFYKVNLDYWGGNIFVESIFDMPLSVLLYTILFFMLGFFLYAFLYGALGSLANRTEDVNTLVLPLTFVFIIAFMAVMFSMSSGNVDTTLMKVLSYVPFTSPVAMFARIAMGEVPALGIMASVVILLATTIGVGYFSAGVYRIGVLLYGKTPKLSEVVKIIRSAR